MSASLAQDREAAGSQAALEWSEIEAMAPRLATTMRCYLLQLGTFLAPSSVDVADNTLRQLARWLLANTSVEAVAGVSRHDIEDFKVWLAARPGYKGGRLSSNTHRQRMRTLRAVLRTDHRVGLAGLPAAQPGNRRRHPAAARAAPEVPRRPRRGETYGGCPGIG
jgi:hypothetical protein